jgi:aspartate aminotransferase
VRTTCSLPAGKLNFLAPPHLVEAAAQAVRDGAMQYISTDDEVAPERAIIARYWIQEKKR